MAAAKIFKGYDFWGSTGSLASAGGSRCFRCISHSDCPMKVKLVSGNADEGGYNLFSSLGNHSSARILLPPSFKGISAEFTDDIDMGVRKGWPPNRIVSELILACGADEEKKLRVPKKEKISARRVSLTSSPQFLFKTAADMLLYVNVPGRLVTTRAEFDAIEDLDQLIVYGTFFYDIMVKDDSPGAAEGATVRTKLSASTSEVSDYFFSWARYVKESQQVIGSLLRAT